MRHQRRWSLRIGIAILAIFVLAAIIGPLLVGNPNATNAPPNSGPTSAHLLGTTSIGQDVLTQLVVGTRGSLFVATLAALIAILIATTVGLTSALLGGIADELLSLFTNTMLVIPTLPLVVVAAGYAKNSGSIVVAIVIAATGWSWGARVLRSQALSLRQRDFVVAARATGESTFRIVTFEVLPHMLPLVAAQFLGIVLFAIVTQAGLAFLGLGGVNNWSWGTMLYWANNAQAFQLSQWWWYVPPGLCIALFGMALVLLNNGLDQIFDNRMFDRGRRRQRRWARGAQVQAAIPTVDPTREEVSA